MSREELLAWAETVLAPAAKLAYEGKGEFKAGDHCQFCKAKANVPQAGGAQPGTGTV